MLPFKATPRRFSCLWLLCSRIIVVPCRASRNRAGCNACTTATKTGRRQRVPVIRQQQPLTPRQRPSSSLARIPLALRQWSPPRVHAMLSRAEYEVLRTSYEVLRAFLPPHSCTASPQRKASLRLRTNETMESGVACTSLPACCCTRRPGASASASSQQSYRPLEQPSPRSASYSCPLAMTDGAARLLEVHMKGRRDLQQLYERLTTRDADRFYTSGQVGLHCIALLSFLNILLCSG